MYLYFIVPFCLTQQLSLIEFNLRSFLSTAVKVIHVPRIYDSISATLSVPTEVELGKREMKLCIFQPIRKRVTCMELK